MSGKKKNAVMLADTRPALVGTLLVQIQDTNPGLFDEAIIYFTEEITALDREIMESVMSCRFVRYAPPLPDVLFNKPRFKQFSVLMFARYDMFAYLEEFETITWLDTDILIQGDLRNMISLAKKTGAAFIREDPINKTSEKPDVMRTCFISDLPGYKMNEYLYCSGTIVLTDKIINYNDFTKWCYQKTIEWADILSLPDQGVLNAAIQEFSIPVTPLSGKKYCCYPYMGRDCSDAIVIHAWGMNKFWNDWYVYLKYCGWSDYYKRWTALGGGSLTSEIEPKISIIIPSYKPKEELLRQSLNSLMNQKRNSWERFSNFEIIIIAEPFEQESIRAIVDSYEDPRIRLEFNNERIGIAASLNRGLQLARGQYIARMDDDDLAGENRMFLQAEFLDMHPHITLCTSDFEYFGDMNERRLTFEGEMSRAWSFFTCPFDHPTIMFRKDFFIYNDLYYDENRGYVEDWELWLRAFDAGMNVGTIHDVLFYHRWINNSSAGQTNKTVDMMRELIQKNFLKLDVEIPAADLELIGPWNGRLIDENSIKKIENYFKIALESNLQKKLYHHESLKTVFTLRLEEARTGVLPGLVEKIERTKTTQNQTLQGGNSDNTLSETFMGRSTKKPSMVKRVMKKIFKSIYAPFRHRYEDRIINIQNSGWTIEGHVLNCIAKLDQIALTQASQADQIMIRFQQTERSLSDLECLCNKLIGGTSVLESRFAQMESRFDQINDRLALMEGRITTLGDKLYDLSQEVRYERMLQDTDRMGKKKAVILGTPEHSNLGDAAITIGEFEFIRKYFQEYALVELSTYDFSDWFGKLAGIINKDDILFLQGGGNLGNRYLSEENVRRRVISDFPENKIVILPQTIHFDDNEEGQSELLLSKQIYNRHKNLTIFTRGECSLDFAKMHFHNAGCASALDMALMLDIDFAFDRSGILLCIRDLNDESGLSEEQYGYIIDLISKLDSEYEKTNNLYHGSVNDNIYKDVRRSAVLEEFKRFARHRVVVTDRLHGLIFSVITHTPCVVMSSYNQKIEEFCKFFTDSNAVFFIDRDLELLEIEIRNAIKIETPAYPILDKEVFGDIYQKIME